MTSSPKPSTAARKKRYFSEGDKKKKKGMILETRYLVALDASRKSLQSVNSLFINFSDSILKSD